MGGFRAILRLLKFSGNKKSAKFKTPAGNLPGFFGAVSGT